MMHIPDAGEVVQTVDDEYGIATGRVGRWEEHFEIDIGTRQIMLHYEDLYEVDRA